jgi:hypothetical protein
MAAGSTYTPIATANGTGSSSVITFSSIPQTYTDLVLVCAPRTSSNVNMYIQFNGDTSSTNYSWTILDGNGTTATSLNYVNGSFQRMSYTTAPNTDNNTNTIMNIMNYTNATTYKTTLTRSNKADAGVDAIVGLWRATPAAITSFTITAASSATFATTSTFSLYGIAAA